MTIHAKPGMNGDTPETFKTEGRRVHRAATDFLDAMSHGVSILHSRNFQHLTTTPTTLRDQDLARVSKAIRAVEDLRDLGIEVFQIGDDA